MVGSSPARLGRVPAELKTYRPPRQRSVGTQCRSRIFARPSSRWRSGLGQADRSGLSSLGGELWVIQIKLHAEIVHAAFCHGQTLADFRFGLRIGSGEQLLIKLRKSGAKLLFLGPLRLASSGRQLGLCRDALRLEAGAPWPARLARALLPADVEQGRGAASHDRAQCAIRAERSPLPRRLRSECESLPQQQSIFRDALALALSCFSNQHLPSASMFASSLWWSS